MRGRGKVKVSEFQFVAGERARQKVKDRQRGARRGDCPPPPPARASKIERDKERARGERRGSVKERKERGGKGLKVSPSLCVSEKQLVQGSLLLIML